MGADAHSQMELESPAATISVPARTPWPMVSAFGVSLMFAGLATSAAVSLLGAIAAVAGVVGWFRAVLPSEQHEEVAKEPQPPPAVTVRREVVRFQLVRETRRAWLPLEIYPISAGIKGGIAGGAVMAMIASAYGIVHGTG